MKKAKFISHQNPVEDAVELLGDEDRDNQTVAQETAAANYELEGEQVCSHHLQVR